MNQNFVLTLHKTYWETGFFNVGVAYDKYIGAGGSQIEIYVGQNQNPINGHINRTANRNGTARIMGGVKLKNWFRLAQVGHQFTVTIMNPNSIRMV